MDSDLGGLPMGFWTDFLKPLLEGAAIVATGGLAAPAVGAVEAGLGASEKAAQVGADATSGAFNKIGTGVVANAVGNALAPQTGAKMAMPEVTPQVKPLGNGQQNKIQFDPTNINTIRNLAGS